MTPGVIWAASIWTLVLLFVAWRDQGRPPEDKRLSLEFIAIVIALLGTHSIVSGYTDTDTILRDPVAGERALRGVLAGVSLVLVGPRLWSALRSNRSHGHRGLFCLAIYLGLAGLSTIYSAATIVTAAKTFELGAGMAAIGALALHENGLARLKRAVVLIITLETALLAVAVAGFFLLPQRFSQLQPRPGFVSELTMASPYAHPNALSSMGALCGVYGLARLLRRDGSPRIIWLVVVVIGLSGTLLASGRQGVVIWIIGAAVLLLIERPRLSILLVAPVVWWILDSFGGVIWDALLRNRPTTIGTLTGRTEWWGAAIDAWKDHPWTGWGYGVGGRFVALESIGRGTTSNLHSGYFEALVGVGIIGLIPLLWAVARTSLWSMRALLHGAERHFPILMLPLLLRTSVSQGFGGWLNFEFMLFACLVGIADLVWIEERNQRNVTTPPLVSTDLRVRVSEGITP